MLVIVAGGRDFSDYRLLKEEIELWRDSVCSKLTLVSGCARGADKFGELYAAENNITIKRFPADWDKHGKSAGYIRNREMATYADALIAFWDGKSKGTKHMIDLALSHGLLVKVIHY